MSLSRRRFLKNSLLATAGLASAGSSTPVSAATTKEDGGRAAASGDIIDTNVYLFDWPFRHLKYGEPDKLVAKLRRHGVRQAWAGTFEALFHKDIDGANRRLVEACGKHRGFLLPFGAVNLSWPGWEEDVRRCHEVYKMPGIRLDPAYQGYDLADPAFGRLLENATRRHLIVQIMCRMEEGAVHHPKVISPDVDIKPLTGWLRGIPGARVVLLNAMNGMEIPRDRALLDFPGVHFDIANLDGAGGIEKVLAGAKRGSYGGRIPVDRILFGSQVPFFPLESALFKFVESELNPADLTAIVSGNATRLLARA